MDDTKKSIEAIERNSEIKVVDFEDYVNICNISNDGSRRRGILSEESYKEIVTDPNTGFINFGNSRIPVLMNVSHGLAMGYDVGRCQEYAKDLSNEIYILTLPVHELNEDEKSQFADLIKTNSKCAMYFGDHNEDESGALAEILDKADISHIEKPLVDSRAAEGDEQAALYLYSCCAEQTEDRGKRKKLNLRDVQEYYKKNMESFVTSDGETMTTLIMGDTISSQQAEEMWDLYNDRFNYLGNGHPISMQDTKEDFLSLLRSTNTIIACTNEVHENGEQKVICFTYFIDDMKELYWLNHGYLDKSFTDSSSRNDFVTNIFTPGLVSSGQGNNYALLPISFFAKVADEAGLSTSVLYENTNLSKRYVPKIVDNAMGVACIYTTLKPSKMVDMVAYRLWSIGGEPE